ncbi:MAG: PEP/pyruvate-binding domain-containing protein, partial [Gammaproteobacteria bacterium]
METFQYVRWFNDIGLEDISGVGGKNASLGEMFCELTPLGINVPDGFAITVDGYWDTLSEAGVLEELKDLLKLINKDDVHELDRYAKKARTLIENAPLPIALSQEIIEAFRRYLNVHGKDISVAVRSSATAEDLPTASFAGQHDTYLNIRTESELLNAYKKCLASLFTSRAIAYRINNKFDHFKVALSVGVMKMIRSDLASSGVMFSLDTESGFKDVVFITAAYGLGENIVQGNVSPDEFYVHKPTFKQGHRAVLRRSIGDKSIKMTYADSGQATQQIATSDDDRKKFCISDEDVLKLAEYAIKTEEHYSAKAGEFRPMDMEWAKDGVDGQLFLIQARPETVISQQDKNILEQYHLKETGKVIIKGREAGTSIAVGKARLIANEDQLSTFQDGEIL